MWLWSATSDGHGKADAVCLRFTWSKESGNAPTGDTTH